MFKYGLPALIINDKKEALIAINCHGYSLRSVSNALANDKDVVLASVKRNGRSLKYASKALQNNIFVVLAAIEQDRHGFEYASETFKKDPKLNEIAIIRNNKDRANVCDSYRLNLRANYTIRGAKQEGFPSNQSNSNHSIESYHLEQSFHSQEKHCFFNTIPSDKMVMGLGVGLAFGVLVVGSVLALALNPLCLSVAMAVVVAATIGLTMYGVYQSSHQLDNPSTCLS